MTPVPLERAPQGRSRTLIAAAIAASVVALLAGAAVLYVKTRSLERAMDEAAVKAAADAPAPAAPAKPGRWKLTLEELPEGASVYVDGALHPERPLIVGSSPDPLEVRVVADGYDDWVHEVAVYSDISVRVSMHRLASDLSFDVEEVLRGEKKGKKGEKGEEKGEEPPGEKGTKIDTTYPGLQ
jgi:hypothetical protein